MKFILFKRHLSVLLCLALMMTSFMILPAAGEAAAVEVEVGSVLPTDDALIRSDNPATNYDICSNCASNTSNKGLWNISSSSSEQKYAFFKFDVSTVSDSTYKYYLQVAAKQGSSATNVTFNVLGYPDNAWNEQTITWNNPAKDFSLAAIIGTYTVSSTATSLYTVDVTDYVRSRLADGAVTLLVTDSSTNNKSTNLYSKESASQPKPKLIAKRVPLADHEPPAWPDGSQLKSSNLGMDFVHLAWPAATDDNIVTNYRIYKNDSVVSTVYGTNTYKLTGLTPNTAYQFKVEAGDAAGNYSAAPLAYSTTTLSAPVSPLTVQEVNASSNDGNVESNMLDNNRFSRWSASGDGQFADFDLGEIKKVGYLGIAFYKGSERTTNIDIQTSADAVTWTRHFSGSSSGNNDNMEAFDIPDTDARFVRIVGHGNSVNTFTSITDVMIYAPYVSGDTPVAVVPNIVPLPPEGTVPFTKPGLTNPDGSVHPVHTPNPVTGQTINVISYGADPSDNNNDDRVAVQNAINAAQAGDEVFLPNGVYNLLTSPDGFVNLKLKTGVNFRGESETGTILKSSIDNIKNSSVVKSSSQHDILVSNMTVSSTWDRTFTTEHSTNNPEAGGPDNGITVANTGETPSYNVTVDHVTVERFRRIGVRIENSHDVVVRNTTFRNATDLGGGGAGYGTSIQGMPKVDRLGFANDTYWNLVENSIFEGPYLRHGSLIQYVAHNNVLRNNKYIQTKLDAIDLHGELEYFNEVHGNEITNILTGGGVGLGNTGGTAPSNHSKSGPFNHIHSNVITNSREGIIVTMGTPDTIIENNIIENTTSTTINNGAGINILNGPRTVIRNNTIRNNTAPNYWGILLEHDFGDRNANNIGQGDPENVLIEKNTVTGNTYGIQLQAGSNIIVRDNLLDNLGTNYSKADGVTATEEWPKVRRDSNRNRSSNGSLSTGSTGAPDEEGTSAGGAPGNLVAESKQVNGKQVASAKADAQAVEAAINNKGEGPVKLVVETPDHVTQVELTLPQEAIQKLNDASADWVTVDTKLGTYLVPVKLIDLTEYAGQLGTTPEHVQMQIIISTNESASEQAKAAGHKVIESVDFTLKAAAENGSHVEITNFNQYIPRSVKSDAALDERLLAVVRVVTDASGNTAYEPVPFTVKAGEVTIYSRSNSTYMLLENNTAFTDTLAHWAKDSIERMANKMIVQGVTKEEFRPDQAVTRAELAALITRTLGLKASSESSKEQFKDVQQQQWYYGTVTAAAEAGIVTGYEDGTFRPNQTITRQEMAVMMDRALHFAGYNEQTSSVVPDFTDQAKIGSWAKEAVSRLLSKKLMEGMSSAAFEPESEATRAQSTVLLQRLLPELNFSK
ncbi:MAG: coagulation factor 5/8 type domain protein [Paenibacillus sp.]|jgi:parallel beta-helix repeat protein|nr:coagulation factor 5/8 type domain protein [Paenibacillus sp.]